MSKQPEALRLAYWLERDGSDCQLHLDAADELRRLHAVNQEMLKALKIADAFCGSLTSDVCCDSVHIPIRDAIKKAEGTV